MQAVQDVTGREDLIDALRKQLLQQLAADLGCDKVAMGDSATRVAVRVVSGTVKGQGFALPGDIQHADARFDCGNGQVFVVKLGHIDSSCARQTGFVPSCCCTCAAGKALLLR